MNIQAPRRIATRFKPGVLLSLFAGFFLPLFLLLGVWQLNRANEKEQWLAQSVAAPLAFNQVDWRNPPLYRQVEVSGYFAPQPLFLMDNKTYNGQFGYEVFSLLKTSKGHLAMSLGWVAGSPDRAVLPSFELPTELTRQSITLRAAPTNPLFGAETNLLHPTSKTIWITQSLTENWMSDATGQTVLGFAQLNNTEQFGVGPVIWQPSVMTPIRHRAYALQWFAMAIALLAMFVYAGFKFARLGQEKNKETQP